MVATSPLMGANLYDGGCSFRVWAPNAKAVFVAFASEAWTKQNHPLTREPSNAEYWSCDVNGVAAGAEYQFVIDNGNGKPNRNGNGVSGENWRADARSRDVNDEDQSDVSSLVVDPINDWGRGRQFSPFATPRYDDLILYQVHVGSFAGMNDGLPAPDHTAQ